jgi:hypothetical protein
VNGIPTKILVFGAFALLLLIGLVLWGRSGKDRASSGELPAIPVVSNPATASSETVVPKSASTPDPRVFETMVSLPTQPPQGGPAITGPVDNVSIRNYIIANPSVAGIQAENVQILSVQYLTVRELKTLLTNSDPFWDSFPPDKQVAYVALTGDFVAETDPSVQGPGATTTYHTAYRIFDVHTGNELGGHVGPK